MITPIRARAFGVTLSDFFLYINNIIIINTKIPLYLEISLCMEPMTTPADKLILKTDVKKQDRSLLKKPFCPLFSKYL